MAGRLRIGLFGQPRFSFDNERLKFNALPRSLALLAYVLLRRDAPIERDALAYALWPDDSEEEAQGKLRRHLYDVQKALPESNGVPWLLVDRVNVAWNGAAGAWLDVEEFERLGAAAATRAAAVELYQGELLEHLYDDWILRERERLRSLYLIHVGELLHLHADRRDYERAIGYAELFLRQEPWREDVFRESMILRYVSGDRSGALHAFEDFAQRLKADMGVDVMPETAAVRDRILANEPIATRFEMRAADGDPDSSPSGTHVARIRAAWQRAARGHGNALFIAGPAGSGKSRLASDVARLAQRQGGRVLTAAVQRPEREPYGVVLDALAAAAAFVPIGALEDLTAPPSFRGAAEKTAYFKRLSEVLTSIARPRPVLLVLEDLHDAGDRTIELVEFLVRGASSQAVLIVGSYDEALTPPGALVRDACRRLASEKLAATIALATGAVNAAPGMQDARLIGRDGDLSSVCDLLRQARCVTITGAPGVGKTSVALQASSDVAASFRDGSVLVDLAPLAGAQRVAPAVATAFGIGDLGTPEQLVDDLTASLVPSEVLIVLDNCEHVLDAVRDIAGRILQTCPLVRILATSRVRLSLEDEVAYRLPSLALPEGGDVSALELQRFAAVELFIERARRVASGFAVTSANAAAVSEIVRRLDGIPLAIELAAARTGVLSPAQIATRLEDRFSLLSSGSPHTRQRTLHAALEWSYDLLDDRERALLRRLGVFRGRWTAGAAVAVCAGGEDENQALAELGALVEKSLVTTSYADDGERRFGLPESIREYALTLLDEAAERDDISLRHCRYFAALALGEFEISATVPIARWLARVKPDLDNYRAAIDWGLIGGKDVATASNIVASLYRYWYRARAEGLELLQRAMQALSGSTPPLVRARVLLLSSYVLEHQATSTPHAREARRLFAEAGDIVGEVKALGQLASTITAGGQFEESLALHREQVALARSQGFGRDVAGIQASIGLLQGRMGDIEAARSTLRESIELYQAMGDLLGALYPMLALAEMSAYAGSFEAAIEATLEAHAVAVQAGDSRHVLNAKSNLAAYLLETDEPAEAWIWAREALALAVSRRDSILLAAVSIHLAQCAARGGQTAKAARLLGFADAIYAGFGTVRELTEERSFGAAMSRLRADVAQPELDELLRSGAALDETSGVALAYSITRP